MAAAGSCQRHALATMSLAVVVAVLAGCTRGGQDENPPTPTAGTGHPSVSPVDVTQDFPVTAEDYAQVTVAAWAAPDPIRLAELAAPDVHAEIIELPGPPHPDWTFVHCAAGEDGSDCAFYNADGDELVLTVDLELLGGPRAAIAASFETTSYPADVVAYVETFVAAWQDGNVPRMHNLAVAAVVEVFVELNDADPGRPEVAYDVGDTVDEQTRVVLTVAGQELSTQVSTALLGEQHAIRSAEVQPVT